MNKEELLTKVKECKPFNYDTFKFKDLSDLLCRDALYSNFEYKEGIRGKENILGGTSWIILDIDDSSITDEEAHLLLEGINHYVVRTSNPDNGFKFRVIIELDMVVTLDSISWKYFINFVGKTLGLTIDPVAQSQLFYSYKDRNILSETEGKSLQTKDLVVKALAEKDSTIAKKSITNAQKKTSLNNPMQTFQYAFDCSIGARSTTMMRMAFHARDLGATNEYIIELITKVNNYIDEPLTKDYVEKTLFSQIKRWR